VMLVAGAELSEVNAKYDLGLDEARAAALRAEFAGSTAGDLKRLGDEQTPFDPSGGQVAASLGLFVLGLGLTRLLGKRDRAEVVRG
jgi:hypothetical protein